MSSLLDVRNLSVTFNTERGVANAVRFVNFSIKPGQTMGIVGESGCGKSVTAKSIMRIVENQQGKISSGEIFFEGVDLVKQSEKHMRSIRGNMISMIFQDPMTSLNPLIKVGKQIAEVLYYHKGLNKQQAKSEAIKMMKDLSIPSPEQRYDNYPHEFSGGMLQRLMIAIALICKPKLLVADEPTTALDVTIQAQILRLMKELQKKYGMSILLITHDLGVVAEVCDTVSVMYAGEIVESAEIERIFDQPLHPYTWGLIESRPVIGRRDSLLKPIEGNPPNLTEEIIGCPFVERCQYKTDICHTEKPVLKEIQPSHQVACHFAETFLKERGGSNGAVVRG